MEFLLELLLEIGLEIALDIGQGFIKNKWLIRIMNVCFGIVMLIMLGGLIMLSAALLKDAEYKAACSILFLIVGIVVGGIYHVKKVIRRKEDQRWMTSE